MPGLTFTKGAATSANGRPHLFIDADDTLWENNVYFERAFQHFTDLLRETVFLGRTAPSAASLRARLDEIENVNRIRYGYGAVQFGRNMQECLVALAERKHTAEHLERVMAIAREIMEHPLTLTEGVAETLGYLAGRYPLTLFTKGDPAEQTGKVDASGLSVYFEEVVVAREKDEAAYRELLARRGAAAERAWMIGNSPKSDINPALAIGMNAVYIPHERNWHLEHEEIAAGAGKLIELEEFRALMRHF